MNQTPIPSSRRRLRRLTAVVGGALLGAAAVLTLASPASAHKARVGGEASCLGNDGWTATVDLTNTWPDNAGNVDWIKVYDADWKPLANLHVTGIQHGTPLAKADGEKSDDDVATGTVAVPATITTIRVKARVVYDDGAHWTADSGKISPSKECEAPPTTPSKSASPPAPAQSPSAPASASPSPVPGTGGGGPQLPTTGASTVTAIVIAAVLLMAGVGLFYFFRRRRIRFTA